jgi:dipeptidyl aminopeptidase/acylaminoacyl peptidase
MKSHSLRPSGRALRQLAPAFGHAAVLLLAVAVSGAAPAAGGLQAYGRLPALDDVTVSPDGTRVAFVRTVDDDRAIAILNLADMKPERIQNIGQTKVRRLLWADNQRLLVVSSNAYTDVRFIGYGEFFHGLLYDRIEGTVRPLPDPDQGRGMWNSMSSYPVLRHVDGHTLIFFRVVTGDQSGFYDRSLLYQYDAQTGQQSRVKECIEPAYSSVIDAHGRVVATEYYVTHDHRWLIKACDAGEPRVVTQGVAAVDVPVLLGINETDHTLLLRSIEEGASRFDWVSLGDGSMTRLRTPDAPLDDVADDDESGLPPGGSVRSEKPRYIFFDPKRQRRWDSLTHAFETANEVDFVSASAGFKKIIARIEGPDQGYQYTLVDFDTHNALRLGDVYEGIAPPYPVRVFDYPAADGLKIHAYLTLPRAHPLATGLPLVVLPHGGPAVADSPGFDWWSQALADQGYAVLRPNFRGSTNDAATRAAGYGEMGRKMQSDLDDGVAFLAKEGTIDPSRVCIAGASYGGYAALAGVTTAPGPYRCAVSISGIGDLEGMAYRVEHQSRALDFPLLRDFLRNLGAKATDSPVVAERSPLRHLDRLKVPVLLVHGDSDAVVPIEQSEAFYKAALKAGKDVRFVTLKDEDHWLSHSATRQQMLQETVAFLRKNNPPDPPPAAGR